MLRTRLGLATGLSLSIAFPGPSGGETLHVPGDFPIIQACIDAAVSGVDECVVAPGTYHETINFLGKAITLRSSGGADATTIDATGIGGSVVTCASGEGPDTILDGFTITGGTGTNVSGFRNGGGMYNYSHSSPTVTNCIFSGNTSYLGGGGGMYNWESSPTVTDCKFSGNTSYRGGGMYNKGGNSTVSRCSYSENTAIYGGGMYDLYSLPTVSHCTFSGNNARNGRGGGMYNWQSSPTVTDCRFNGNRAYDYGGGMYNWDSSLTVTNCTFSRNAASDGGGMYNYTDSYFNHSPTVANCIVWGDSPNEIVHPNYPPPTIRFSNVQGGLPMGAVDGGGNINLDPIFVRPSDPGPDGEWDGVDDDYGDLRLQAGSPSINAGDPAFVPQPGETDLDGHARMLCGQVDMGAYEFGIGDYDCDQTVNLTDFAHWWACATQPQSGPYDVGCEAFDFDGDGDVDLFDFAGFQIDFGEPIDASNLAVFDDPDSDLATYNVRDVDDDFVRFDTSTNSIIWAATGVAYQPGTWTVNGPFLAGGFFKVRFGAQDGQRRAYFTETGPATICQIQVSGANLFISPTNVPVPQGP